VTQSSVYEDGDKPERVVAARLIVPTERLTDMARAMLRGEAAPSAPRTDVFEISIN